MDADYRPGDVLLFRGSGIKSLAIAAFTNLPSQWLTDCAPSHVGVVADFRDRAMLFESTTLCDLPCEILKRKIKGVQAHNPEKRAAAYKGRVWRMRLPAEHTLSRWQSEKLTDACQSHLGDAYGFADLLHAGSILGRIRTWLPTPKHEDCARFVALVLRDACVIGRNVIPARMSPAYIARTWPWMELYEAPVRIK